MENKDIIEIYHANKILVRLSSSMVLPVGSYLNILGKTWKVVLVTFAVDHANDPWETRMRCNIDVEPD